MLSSDVLGIIVSYLDPWTYRNFRIFAYNDKFYRKVIIEMETYRKWVDLNFYICSCSIFDCDNRLKPLIICRIGPIIEWDELAWSYYSIEGYEVNGRLHGCFEVKQYCIEDGLTFSNHIADPNNNYMSNQDRHIISIIKGYTDVDKCIRDTWYGSLDIKYEEHHDFLKYLKPCNEPVSTGHFHMDHGIPHGKYRMVLNFPTATLTKIGEYRHGKIKYGKRIWE